MGRRVRWVARGEVGARWEVCGAWCFLGLRLDLAGCTAGCWCVCVLSVSRRHTARPHGRPESDRPIQRESLRGRSDDFSREGLTGLSLSDTHTHTAPVGPVVQVVLPVVQVGLPVGQVGPPMVQARVSEVK